MLEGYEIFNARITLRDPSDKRLAVLWAKNLTDELITRDRYSSQSNPWAGPAQGSYLLLYPPRTVGLDFTWNFGS